MSHCLLLVLLLSTSTVSHWLLKKRSIKDFPPHHYCGRVPLWHPMRCTIFFCIWDDQHRNIKDHLVGQLTTVAPNALHCLLFFALLSLFITCPWLLSTAFTKLKEMISTVLLCFSLLCTIFHCFSQFCTVLCKALNCSSVCIPFYFHPLCTALNCFALLCTVFYTSLNCTHWLFCTVLTVFSLLLLFTLYCTFIHCALH